MTDTVEPVCMHCGAEMIPGPRGGAAQNFYCTDRVGCRQGFNLTIWNGDLVMRQDIGEVDDERYAMYSQGGDHGYDEEKTKRH
jgi:hypothetical protein